MHEARLYQKLEDNTVRSRSAPTGAPLKMKHGICGVRINRGGTLYAATFGKVIAEAVDPIEKKPLYHFLPGSLYSLGGVGCNFTVCLPEQQIPANSGYGRVQGYQPRDRVERAIASGSASIAWTYNEPTIWHEYPLEMGALARQKGLGTVYVTNGYITEEGLRDLAGMLNAFRVDIKSFSDAFYRKVCGGRLQPVLDAALLAKELGMHIETLPCHPGQNDSMEMEGLIRWVVENLDLIRRCTSQFHLNTGCWMSGRHRSGRLKGLPTGAKGRSTTRTGNVGGHPTEHYRPSCGNLIIERAGYIRIRGPKGILHEMRISSTFLAIR